MTDRPVKQINAFTTQATPANGDFLLIQEATGSLYKKTTLQNVIATVGIVVDLTPQLGGDLDTNSQDITGGVRSVSGSSGATANTTADEIVAEGSGNAGISILTPNSNIGRLLFGDPQSNTVGRVQYDHNNEHLTLWEDGAELMRLQGANVGIGVTAMLAKLHVDQDDTVGAIPALYLDQADVSEEMIEFNTTIGVGNAIEAVGAKSLTVTHFIKITLPGSLTRYIEVGTIA